MAKDEDRFKVPVSSKGELDKIIKAYAHLGKSATLDEVARLTGMNRTRVSANNAFLSACGLIEGGKVKGPSSLGIKLGRALDHEQQEDVRRTWQEVIEHTQFLSDLITSVRLKKGMTLDDLVSHALYAAGLAKGKGFETGARTIVEILLESGLVAEADGKLSVAASKDKAAVSPSEPKAPEFDTAHHPSSHTHQAPPSPPPAQPTPIMAVSQAVSPSVVINIQLEIPATESEAVYNNFFRALRENLLDPKRDK